MRLLHFSEDPAIEVFAPHVAKTAAEAEPLVWAIDEEHSPLYWFPRDCPRCTWWPPDDLAWDKRVHAIEWDWLNRVRDAVVYAYVLPADSFELRDMVGGYYVSTQTVETLERQPVGPLLDRHRDAGIELRLVDNLWPLWDEVVESGRWHFSGVRLRNAKPPPASLPERDWRT